MKKILVLVCLLFSAPAFAQSHADVVASVKNALVAQHVDLSGPCGAFQITKRVAWQLKAEGAGLLDKPSGNNCQGFATDIIVYPSGKAFDILIDGGGSNGPTWGTSPDVDPGRWRAPSDPGDGPVVPPTPPPPDLSALINRIVVLEASSDAHEKAIANSMSAIARISKDLDGVSDNVRSLNDLTATQGAELAKHADDIARIDGYLASHPIPGGCGASFFGFGSCHLTF